MGLVEAEIHVLDTSYHKAGSSIAIIYNRKVTLSKSLQLEYTCDICQHSMRKVYTHAGVSEDECTVTNCNRLLSYNSIATSTMLCVCACVIHYIRVI